ncbi:MULTISPECIES: beta-1,6-N-acetylglucosaminyltransferase [unclassified Geodermatophilus]
MAALDPFPVLLHCDARTPSTVFREMTADLPGRVTVMPRHETPWGLWGAVEAELEGYRLALHATDAGHVALLSGADYPLVSSGVIADVLRSMEGRSLTYARPMPVPEWGRDGGRWRLRFRFTAWNRHMVWVPVPRRMPQGVVPAGGSSLKLLARSHVAALLRAVEERPDLVRRWRHTWTPDETFIPSLLHTPAFVPRWTEERVRGSAWVIRWVGRRPQSPPWLTMDDLDELRQELSRPSDGVVKLFARKFSTDRSTPVLEVIDREFRSSGLVPAGWPMTSSPQ